MPASPRPCVLFRAECDGDVLPGKLESPFRRASVFCGDLGDIYFAHGCMEHGLAVLASSGISRKNKARSRCRLRALFNLFPDFD
jgi:hypothetical protein